METCTIALVSKGRIAAQVLRVLPRMTLSWLLGRIAELRAPRWILNAVIGLYLRAYDVDMSEALLPAGGFESFDEFFTRRLQPGARPPDPEPRAVLSPADGRVEDLGPIDPDAVVLVKGVSYRLADLLGDEETALRYAGGQYAIIYLSPRDYHRVHAPVSGPVHSVRYVPGTLYPVNQIGVRWVPQLFARNERVATTQHSPQHGEVTTLMVGAIGVGRIGLSFDELQTNRGHTPGIKGYADGVMLKRGDELGVFHLGSTAMIFTTPACQLRFVAEPNTTVRVGQVLGLGGGA